MTVTRRRPTLGPIDNTQKPEQQPLRPARRVTPPQSAPPAEQTQQPSKESVTLNDEQIALLQQWEQIHKELSTCVGIDRNRLEENAEEQPTYYVKVVDVLSEITGILKGDSKNKGKGVEYELKQYEAKLDQRIRLNPQLYGLTDKVTEKAISSAMQDNQQLQALTIWVNSLNAANRKFELLRTTFDQRKSLIKYEAELWINEYFSKVSVRDEMTKRAFAGKERPSQRRRIQD
jgi:hypothetical protein